MHFFGYALLLLVTVTSVTPQRSSEIQARYLPPPSQDRDRSCTSGNCRGEERLKKDDYEDSYKTESEKDRPPFVGRDGWPSASTSRARSDSDYKPKPVSSSASRSDDDPYYQKSNRGRDGAGEIRSVKPDVEYYRKPEEYPKTVSSSSNTRSRSEVSEKDRPAILGRDDWPSTSTGGRAGVGSDYKPKPAASSSDRFDDDSYYQKPSSSRVVASGGEERSTKIDDEYYRKPEEYPKPVRNSGSSSSAEERSYYPKAERDEYKPKPAVRDDYEPKPVRRDEYVPRPVDRDYTKPIVRDEYIPKPVIRDEYVPKPSRDEYVPKPSRDDYYPKSEKPVIVDEYIPKPVSGIRADYRPKPLPANKEYDKRVTAEEYYPYPVPEVADVDLGDDYNDYKIAEEIKINGDSNRPIPVVEDDKCICVPYYQCREGHIVTDGAGIIDARRNPQPDEDLPLDGKFKPPSCGPFHVCCNTPESSTVKPYEHRCGVRNPSGINSRILSPSNKGEADFGEWPWQAAVLKSEGTVNIFQCGGVLIDKYHVLTVAHCVFHLYKFNEYPLKVRLGEWDTQTTGEFLAHEDYKVSKIYIHPEFRNTSLWNDVALLRLEEPVLFAPHIDTVCLPKYDEIFSGQNCVVTGWGKDSYKGGTFSNVMKEVALEVIDSYKCEEMLRKTRLGRFFQLHEGFICAGGEHGLDSCKGDGGGPLVCYRKDRSYALAGLVSWGIDCGQPGVPGVYVRIQKYLDWISKNTGVTLQDYWPKSYT